MKQDAYQAFRDIAPNEKLLEEMLEAIEVQQRSIEWTEEEGKYIPSPYKWLKGRRWEDRLTPTRAAEPESSFEIDEFFYASLLRTLKKYGEYDEELANYLKGMAKKNDN